MVKKSNSSITTAEAIVEVMKREQVEHVFCVPGESYLPLLDALYDEQTIQVISNRHEGGAAFMAEGYAKSTLKPGIVLATRGVGATNLSIGVHTAFQDSTPMIVLLGQVHSKFLGREGFQEVNLDAYFNPITKWMHEVRDPERMPEIMQRAFRIATTGRPGPVVISLPEDVLPVTKEMVFGPQVHIPRPAPAENDVQSLETLLNKAEKPVIIAGGGVKSSQGEEALINFAENFNIPVVAAFRRHDIFSHNHPLYAGHLGLSSHPSEIKTIQTSDLILVFGSRLCEVTTQGYSIISPEQKLVHVDIDYSSIGKVYPPNLGIIADVKEALKKFQQMNVQVTWESWAEERNRAYRADSEVKETKNNSINQQVNSILNKNLSADTLLTVDAGNFAGWVHAYYKFNEPHTFVGPTSGAMGYGMPAALGAKLAHPNKHVVALAGDGGFMMTVQELETAVRHKIPVLCVVFNNQMYGTIRMHQEIHYPKKVMATDLGDVSFAKLAQSMGAVGYTAKTAEEFATYLEKSLKRLKSKPIVIEVKTPKEQISVRSTITQLRNEAKN